MKLTLVSLLLAPALSAATLTYDAALGTQPTSQGFSLFDTTASGPAPSVSGGLLNQGPTPAPGEQYWYRTGIGANLATDFIELTARVRVQDSPLVAPDPGAGFRTGFGIMVSDVIGNTFSLFLANDRAIVTPEYDAVYSGSLVVPCDCTEWHTFRILAGGGASQVFLDGLLVGVAPLLLNASSLNPRTNTLLFGDPTNVLGHQSQIEYISVASVPAIPEPSTALLTGPLALLLYVARRKMTR